MVIYYWIFVFICLICFISYILYNKNNSDGFKNVDETGEIIKCVYLQIRGGVSGTNYLTGTSFKPVNNLTDALLIATKHNIDNIVLDSEIVIPIKDINYIKDYLL